MYLHIALLEIQAQQARFGNRGVSALPSDPRSSEHSGSRFNDHSQLNLKQNTLVPVGSNLSTSENPSATDRCAEMGNCVRVSFSATLAPTPPHRAIRGFNNVILYRSGRIDSPPFLSLTSALTSLILWSTSCLFCQCTRTGDISKNGILLFSAWFLGSNLISRNGIFVLARLITHFVIWSIDLMVNARTICSQFSVPFLLTSLHCHSIENLDRQCTRPVHHCFLRIKHVGVSTNAIASLTLNRNIYISSKTRRKAMPYA